MKNKSQYKQSIVKLHIAVILFGFTAILGVCISLDAIQLVWWRMLIASVSMPILLAFGPKIKTIPFRQVLIFASIGFIVSIHWVTFYASIKLSNASTALICFSTAGFFTAIFEPILLKKQIDKLELIIGMAVVPAMFFIIHSSPKAFGPGILLGILSAILIALFASLNKLYLTSHSALYVSFIELCSGFFFLSLGLILYTFYNDQFCLQLPKKIDIFYLVLLGVFCTTVAYSLAMDALKHLSAFTSNLTINLEPVYGIILAHLLFNDQKELNIGFYIGTGMIFLTILAHTYYHNKKTI